MPTIATSNVPPPRSWDEFEDICLSAAKLRWRSEGFYRHGRQGQRQEGVDIWGHDPQRQHIGIQCKNTIAGVSEATVKAEITNSVSFTPPLDALYIATSSKRHAAIQRYAREISAQRLKAGKCSVDILFWEDLCQDLALDDQVFFKHFPQFRPDLNSKRASPAASP